MQDIDIQRWQQDAAGFTFSYLSSYKKFILIPISKFNEF